jgi:flagellar biogenesis protein FliO
LFEYADYLKFISSFVIILIFIYAIYYAVNRYGTNFAINKKGKINIEEIRYLSKNKGLFIVQVENSKFLFSFDEKGINKIKEWEATESLDNENKNISQKFSSDSATSDTISD